jgi:hypothetical protein
MNEMKESKKGMNKEMLAVEAARGEERQWVHYFDKPS